MERGAEVGAVDGGVSGGFGVVCILAPRAVELDGLEVGDVGEPEGQQWVGVAHDAWAFPEVGLLVFLELWEGKRWVSFVTGARANRSSEMRMDRVDRAYHFR